MRVPPTKLVRNLNLIQRVLPLYQFMSLPEIIHLGFLSFSVLDSLTSFRNNNLQIKGLNLQAGITVNDKQLFTKWTKLADFKLLIRKTDFFYFDYFNDFILYSALVIIFIFFKVRSIMAKSKFEDLLKDSKKMKKLMEQAFRKVDIDGSGFLERSEFEQVLIQIAKEIGVDNPTREEVEDILDLIDENGDDRISNSEFG